MSSIESNTNSGVSDAVALFRLIVLSSLGIFFFFIPITIGERSTIPLDHIMLFVKSSMGNGVHWYTIALIAVGAAIPFYDGSWKSNLTNKVFTLFKVAGLGIGILAVSGWGPELLQSKDMLPFLYNKLAIPVGLIVPIGAVFLALLVSYGLLELVGILIQPVMQPIWRTPGKSAIDAVASFVGSYSLGLLITNRVYLAGHYSQRDAAIIATGFSTVSVTFMIIVARTLGLMDIWNLYFWTAAAITFIVTAITVRIPPLSKFSAKVDHPEPTSEKGERLVTAYRVGITAAREAPSLAKNMYSTFIDGLKMAMSILPSIMSIGLAGLLLAKYTPVFDWLGLAFYPFIAIWGMEDALALSQASAAGLAEMFLPALLMKDAMYEARFVAGVICVSSILFFSASIPCILSTKIPISVPQIVFIWFVRTALGLLIAVPVSQLLL